MLWALKEVRPDTAVWGSARQLRDLAAHLQVTSLRIFADLASLLAHWYQGIWLVTACMCFVAFNLQTCCLAGIPGFSTEVLP